ncbi:hypothetical protein NDU88_007504 [Pleurodeles waltl]|uniref:Uncharacterized protein n=1 Tax=Pleurodeles waltl TaxID=8319 RepID=A0AAV7U3V9_PLEWA|nr:hypothetical protein NDU88_007504 [Pleurodeles waltl]
MRGHLVSRKDRRLFILVSRIRHFTLRKSIVRGFELQGDIIPIDGDGTSILQQLKDLHNTKRRKGLSEVSYQLYSDGEHIAGRAAAKKHINGEAAAPPITVLHKTRQRAAEERLEGARDTNEPGHCRREAPRRSEYPCGPSWNRALFVPVAVGSSRAQRREEQDRKKRSSCKRCVSARTDTRRLYDSCKQAL